MPDRPSRRSSTIETLVQAGFTPDSATSAVVGNDWNLLRHTTPHAVTLGPGVTNNERRAPSRDDVRRSVPFTVTRTDDTRGDGLTIEGYGAVFDSVTQIDSWEGSFEEMIARGAFRKSLGERVPKMQFDHGRHPLVGSLPLGRWESAKEDERGLYLVGRLTDNWLTQPFRDAIRDGGVDGMSFRFSVVKEEWVDKDGKRIKEDELLDLLWRGAGDRGPIRRILKEVRASEAGPVVWPAYEDTSVGVRSVTIDLGRLREPEERRRLADAVALADAMTGLSTSAEALRCSLIDRGLDPRQATRIASFEPRTGHTALASVQLQRSEADDQHDQHDEHDHEPHATGPAVDHSERERPPEQAPTAEPGDTRRPAGTHSARPERPRNPYDRARFIRDEYLRRQKHVMALDRIQRGSERSLTPHDGSGI